MSNEFDSEEAKKYLIEREQGEKEKREKERLALLNKALTVLKEEFKDSSAEVFLVGSLLRPYQFTGRSDIDIVVKNYHEDRLGLWTRLEKKIDRNVEIILFETCSFKEFVLKEGLKVH